jgi:adenosylhomocysteine nucleosidase
VTALAEVAAARGAPGVEPGAVVTVPAGALVRAGLGATRAESAARMLVERGATALWSVGDAGALDASLVAGDLLLPTGVRAAGGAVFGCDVAAAAALRSTLPATVRTRSGILLDARAPVASAAEKARLLAETRSVAVDMESAAVAAVARAAGIPFLAVRAIADTASQALPRAALVALDGDGRLRPLPLALALFCRPRDVPRLLALRASFRAACATLAMLPPFLPAREARR